MDLKGGNARRGPVRQARRQRGGEGGRRGTARHRQGSGSLSDKAKRAGEALKEPGADGPARPGADTPAGPRDGSDARR